MKSEPDVTVNRNCATGGMVTNGKPTSMGSSTLDAIHIKVATTNNLKGITVDIPKHAITVVTGVSGSGKSSLVFSTLAAISQRNVNSTYSAYVQQLLPKFGNPKVESISNLPFSIVVDQKPLSGNARSTVGTYSDIYTALRLLFSRAAKPFIGYSMSYSFNNPTGMCPKCEGLGYTQTLDPSRLLDMSKSLNEGAIRFPTFQPGGWRLTRYTDSDFFDNDLPLKQWRKEDVDLLLNGPECKPPHPAESWHKTATYMGVIPRIEQSFVRKDTKSYERELDAVSTTSRCPACGGTRINEKARSAKIAGLNIADCSAMSLTDLNSWLHALDIPDLQRIISGLEDDLDHLETVGLGYLSLERVTSTLSGGEAQRLKLAKYLGSSMSDVLYIFDEPSTGLHPRDLVGVNAIFKELRAQGNTVVIVDHDEDVISCADHIIDLGPGAGEEGGTVTFEGTYKQLLQSDTVTGMALSDHGAIGAHRAIDLNDPKAFLTVYDYSNRTVHHVSIRVPCHALTVVTGVAGSGKSTLIAGGLRERYPQAIMLDQRPIHASSRSTVLSYLGTFDTLRSRFARATHHSPALFSFNSKGACPTCKGKGVVTLDIAYLGDAVSTCDDCNGLRYSRQALAPTYRGYNIAEVMRMPASQAKAIYPKTLGEVGMALEQVRLGYLYLGQSLDTLSGGELQRLKLARLLIGDTSDILILDEPTTGLHESNVQQLIDMLQRLIDGHGLTIVAIEHNLRFIGQADWLIDMGPGAGAHGGKVLFQGSPSHLARSGSTPTAYALRRYFGIKGSG